MNNLTNDDHASPDRCSVDAWQERYETGNIGWDRGSPNETLMGWLTSGELQPCAIVVPGCGYAHEVIELARRGFDVTAIDFARAPIECLLDRLGEQNLAATVCLEDVFKVRLDKPTDAVYEQTFLCAIRPEQRPAYARLIHEWLRPGGKLYASFIQCDPHSHDGPPFHCPIDEMQKLFRPNQWIWPHAAPKRVEHSEGVDELAIILSRK